MRGFIAFLKNYGVIGLALAVIIGGKLNTLVTSVVDGLLMPLVGPLIPGGNWRAAIVAAGPFRFQPGIVLAALIDFLIVAWVVYAIAQRLLKEETVAKK
jgi:large conductance mechanosensitive channel